MNYLKNTLAKTTYGQISLASLVISIVSGIILAIPFEIENPFLSISRIMILNPAASFVRNLHFWSSQFFLVFSLIHIWDHFNKSEEIRTKIGVWLRLSLGVVIIFLAMLTGFLLKGDADSKQAFLILESLIKGIPLIGNAMAYSFLGNEDSLLLIYVHHIATFTIFIVIITFEHSRKTWPKMGTFLVVTLLTALVSFVFTAPLHDGLNPSVKGPWYFVGFQEVLHWLTQPDWSLIIIGVFVILIFIIPFSGKKISFLSKRSLLLFTVFYILLTISGIFFRGENWKWIWPWEKDYSYSVLHSFKTSAINLNPNFSQKQFSANTIINGGNESCVVCHDEVSGFTASHNPEAIGCFSCHGGNPFDGNKNGAHKNMVLIPGNFADADRSCGTTNCHPEITQRRNSNLMENLSGMISVDRFVFNEQDNPDLLTDIHHLGSSAADEHLKNLCVICHLGNPKIETGPITERSRGGGCLACHLNYDEFSATANISHKLNSKDSAYLNHHPSISMQVSDQHCFGCHSRSGRISTNFEGWHETTLEVEEMPQNSNYRLVEEARVFTFIEEDIHHKLGLNCIDCHNSFELMGDGNFYSHQENQTTITCEDCHFDGEPNIVKANKIDSESAIIASMRFGNITNKEFLATAKRDIPLINTYFQNDTAFFVTKNHGEKFILSKPGKTCTKGNAHDNVSCSACHSTWAPSCIGCHNEYDVAEPGYNMQENIEKQGSWVEFIGEYNAHAPALGVRLSNGKQEIIPVVPGMVLTIDVGSFNKQLHDSLIFQRLFAPASPHTTSSEGRSCQSCHFNSIALGYGDGEFIIKEGILSFNSKYQNNPNDGLPEDAWIAFLGEPKSDKFATRSNLTPFTIEQQKNILRVGVCLTCHADDSKIMQKGLVDFKSILEMKSEKCVVLFTTN